MATKRKSSAKPKTRVVYRSAKKKATRRRSRRRGLSAASPAAIKSSLSDIGMAALGALAASFLKNQKFMDSQSETNKGLILTGAAVITAVFVKQPRIAAGMGAVAGLTLAKGLGAGSLVGLSENMLLPISEGVNQALLPYGLEEGGMDYAGISENVYNDNYGNNWNQTF